MFRSGPIVLIDDDPEDMETSSLALDAAKVPNTRLFFENGALALEYLKTTKDSPFVILCDINMPVMNGFELRTNILKDASLMKKAIPFIYLSTSDSQPHINEAYMLNAQGYFTKPSSLKELVLIISKMNSYWSTCERNTSV